MTKRLRDWLWTIAGFAVLVLGFWLMQGSYIPGYGVVQ
jgi:hypothetical protein